jgi:predicted ATPase
LTLFDSRFRQANGCLFILDEPEAALSPANQFAFMRILKRLLLSNNQIIMASHSPILMAYPASALMMLDKSGVHQVDFAETSHFLLWRQFVKRPKEMVSEFLADDEPE